jgi:hypothetical protein
LRAAGIGLDTLIRLARADHAGRAEAAASGGRPDREAQGGFPNEALFVERAQRADRDAVTHAAVVKGRHALARGVPRGPEMGALLAQCREIQEETGWADPSRILDRALLQRRSGEAAESPRRSSR